MIATTLAVPRDRKKRRCHRLRGHDPRGIGKGFRVNPLVQSYGQILWLIVDCLVGLVDQLQAEDQRVLLRSRGLFQLS